MTKTSNLPINPTELLKQQLAQANERVAQSEARRIKIGVQGFTAPDGSVGDALEVVVVDYTITHSFFEDSYDPDNIVPPLCHSNSRVFQELAPVEGCPSPQAEGCAVCPQNRFGSAPNGRAKACRNYRLLAVLPVDALDSAPIWTFSVAPTSTGRWDNYVRDLRHENLTPMFAKTKVTFELAGTYAKPQFEMLEPLGKNEVASVIARLDEARQILDMRPDWSAQDEPKKKKGK